MNTDLDPYQLAQELLGFPGAMLSGSKTADPERRVVWNGNVCLGKMKIWYGDISITEQRDNLQQLANQLEATVFVLREMDARFDKENNPELANAVEIFEPLNV